MPRVLVTGANRGLGLEFARQYAAAGWDVIAGCRHPQEASELAGLGKAATTLELDVADDRSQAAFLRALAGAPIDVAIMNAGIGAGGPRSAAAVTPSRRVLSVRSTARGSCSRTSSAPSRLEAASPLLRRHVEPRCS
jgi:NAD(P)-dependent dehydrogenase (short-subunit alcohol dehydrogenase family)